MCPKKKLLIILWIKLVRIKMYLYMKLALIMRPMCMKAIRLKSRARIISPNQNNQWCTMVVGICIYLFLEHSILYLFIVFNKHCGYWNYSVFVFFLSFSRSLFVAACSGGRRARIHGHYWKCNGACWKECTNGVLSEKSRLF